MRSAGDSGVLSAECNVFADFRHDIMGVSVAGPPAEGLLRCMVASVGDESESKSESKGDRNHRAKASDC